MRTITLILLLLPSLCFSISTRKIDRITSHFVDKFDYSDKIIDEMKVLDYKCLVRAIASIESDYEEEAVVYEKNVDDFSYGLMMLRCDTAKGIGLKRECEILLDPWWNIYYGIKYFNKQLRRYNNDVDKAIAAYNAGKVYICRTGKTRKGKKCEIGKFTNQRHVDRFKKKASSCVIHSFLPKNI